MNFLRSEPASAPQSSSRFFVIDQNRNLYILDKTAKTFTPYINFEEVFPRFDNDPGFAGGLVTFAFDPDYADNGKFYTVHTEDPNKSGSDVPTNTSLPGLDLSGGYTTTTAVNPPAGTVARQAVLVEWTDTNRNDSTFEGTAREILRVGFNTNIHPMGDLLFNPLAQPGEADYGNLYISVGDGGAGERADAAHTIPQRLDALQGKILRITPDISLRPADDLSSHGRYRIPTTGSDPNPFVSLSLTDLKKEIYAYGFRNPHRMSWDSVSNKLIVDDIGLHAWEEVNILTKGANYGYAEREGIEQLLVGGTNNGKTGSQTIPPTPFPDPDSLTVTGIVTPVTPVYPVAQYSHEDGDAISSGFVYRGSLMPELYGKYIFGDITTARLFYADLADMIAKHDGDRTSLAAVHELQVAFDSPYDNPDRGPVNRRLFDIVADEYASKGGDTAGSAVLPGAADVTSGNDPDGIPYGGGRADIRLALGGDGEIYVLSKSDGMIRQLVAVVAGNLPPTGQVTIAGAAVFTRSASVTLSLSASDPDGVSQMCISNTGSCSGWQPYATAVPWMLSTGDGVKTVSVWFRDRAGNATPSPVTDQITLDTVPPTNPTSVTSTSHDPNTWSRDRTVEIGWAGAADAGSGVSGYAVKWDKVATTSPNPVLTTTQSTATSPSLGDGATHHVHLRTTDHAANWSASAVHVGPFLIDGTRPNNGTLTATPGPGRVSLSWSKFRDTTSGLAVSDTYLLVVSTTRSPTSSCASGTPIFRGTDTSFVHGNLTAGTRYYYRVCAFDRAGNVSTGTTRNAIPQ